MVTDLEKSQQLLTPVVQSTANPKAELLLQIRSIVQTSKETQELFLQMRKESKGVTWLTDMLAVRMAPQVLGDYAFEDVVQACLYLVDEFNQLGDGYFIVSTETGKTVSVVTDDDLYDPGQQARHSGQVAQALRRLRPSTEVMLVTYHHEKAREANVLQQLTERVHQTDLLKAEGDPRLRMATRAGRSQIAQDLSEDSPWELLRRSGGTSGMFLRHFPLKSDDLPRGMVVLKGTAVFRSTIQVQDALTLNLNYNRLGTLRSATPQGWIRDIARQLTETAYKRRQPLPVSADDLVEADLDGPELWVVDPDTYKYFLRVKSTLQAVPVEGVSPLGLKGSHGYLWVADRFEVESRELFQRWEVTVSLEYKLHLFDWDSLHLKAVLGIPREALIDH